MLPKAMAGDEPALTAHNLEIAKRINDGGAAYLDPSEPKGRQILRLSIGCENDERHPVQGRREGQQGARRNPD